MNHTLRKIRIEKGYSQEYVANRLEITQKAYSKIENNEVQLRMDKAEKLSVILGVEVHLLCVLSETVCTCRLSHEKYIKLLAYLNAAQIQIPEEFR